MLLRKMTRYSVLIISILTASLLAEYLTQLAGSYYKERTYLSVFIGILLTVVVFLPILELLKSYVKKASRTYISTGKKMIKSSWLGLGISFSIAFFILFVLFAQIRHDKDVLQDIKTHFSNSY